MKFLIGIVAPDAGSVGLGVSHRDRKAPTAQICHAQECSGNMPGVGTQSHSPEQDSCYKFRDRSIQSHSLRQCLQTQYSVGVGAVDDPAEQHKRRI